MRRGPGEGVYRSLAPRYDRFIGRPFCAGLCQAFERLVRRYGIRFRTAADLGCGTGLFAAWLSRSWGVPVYAVDRSASMLERARRNVGPERVRLVRQDIRRLRLPRRVELVTANFDTLNHLLSDADVRRVLWRVHETLVPGGHLVFDALTPGLCRYSGHGFARHVGRDLLVQRVGPCSPDGSFRAELIRLRPGDPETRFFNRERAYHPRRLIRWLREAGFEVRGVLDARTLRPAVGCPPRVVMVVRARPESPVTSSET